MYVGDFKILSVKYKKMFKKFGVGKKLYMELNLVRDDFFKYSYQYYDNLARTPPKPVERIDGVRGFSCNFWTPPGTKLYLERLAFDCTMNFDEFGFFINMDLVKDKFLSVISYVIVDLCQRMELKFAIRHFETLQRTISLKHLKSFQKPKFFLKWLRSFMKEVKPLIIREWSEERMRVERFLKKEQFNQDTFL